MTKEGFLLHSDGSELFIVTWMLPNTERSMNDVVRELSLLLQLTMTLDISMGPVT